MIVYHTGKVPGFQKRPEVTTKMNSYEEIQVVEVIDKEKDQFNVVHKAKITKTIDTQKLTESFAGVNGVETVFKKMAITGDASLLGTINDESYTDITDMPTNIHEASSAVAKGRVALGKVSDIVGQVGSEKEALDKLDKNTIDAYIASTIEKILGKKEVKSDE